MTRRFAVAFAAAAGMLVFAAPMQAAGKGCDPIGGGACMLPFPNDFFTRKDASTATGRRLALRRAAMPANKDGVRIDPREWNRADGFSPGQQITVRIPGLDSGSAFQESGIVPITDIARSLDKRQPVVVLDARSGKRQLIWAELDSPRRRRGARCSYGLRRTCAQGAVTSSRSAGCAPRAGSGFAG